MGLMLKLLILTLSFRHLVFLISTFWVLGLTSGKLVNFDMSPNNEPSSSHSIESPDILEVFADELQEFRMDLTKSFIVEHSRRKRETLKYSYEVSQSQNQNTKSIDSFETRTDITGYSTCLYKNQTYVFQADGIYRLDGLQESRKFGSHSRHNLIKVTPMTLDLGEHVLTTQEWDGVLFILTSNQDGSYCKLYTVHGPTHILTMKHQIKNEGYATAATFFVHSFELYLIIATDNVAHSLTITPIYRWSQTYMDQIHEIQTRGAVAVVSFLVSSNTYIAIAQSQDASGNYEVGTLVVRVYGKGELEKVQLLWSIEPVSLSYVRFFKEHLLVIGQKKESSICYWFGGYQFIYWQSLEGLQGNSVFLDSFVLPDNEPLLLASTDTTVSLYTRIKNQQIGETWMLNRSSEIYSTSSSSQQRILAARFLKTGLKPAHNDFSVYVALTIQSSFSSTVLKIFPFTLNKVDIGKGEVESKNKLSLCMTSLKEALDHDESSLLQIESQNDYIITKSGDLTYNGLLLSQREIIMSHSLASIDLAQINPDMEYSKDRYSSAPFNMLHTTGLQMRTFENLVKQKLNEVLLKSKTGNITGDLTFLRILRIQNLKSYSPIYLETLNGVLWSTLEHDILRSDPLLPQIVTGNWEIETLKANEIQTGERIGESFISNFLLTTSEYGKEKETVSGKVTFARDIEFEDLRLGPYAIINDIPFGEIVLRSDKYVEIQGYKHAEYVIGGDQLDIDFINGLKLGPWYESMLKIDGVTDEIGISRKIFTGDLVINSLDVNVLNRLKWNDFAESILLDGKNQTITGSLSSSKLKVNALHLETINGVYVDDWMTTSTNQNVRSNIHVNELKIRQNLRTESINNIRLADAVLSTQPNVRILGPIELKGITAGNISMTLHTRLNGIHISSAAKLRKKHIYYTNNEEGLTLDGNVQIPHLVASSLNGVPFASIRDAYWRTDTENVILSDFTFGSSKIVVEGEFSTGTFNSLDVANDIVTTTTSDDVISRNIQFTSDVIVDGAVVTPDGVTLNGYDISELVKDIVRTTDGKRRVTGRKEFVDLIEARQGIQVKTINGMSLESELVLLDGYGRQEIYGQKKFLDVVAEEMVSEVNMLVEGSVNGEKLAEIISSTLYSDSEIIQIESDLIFEETVAAEELYVKNEINGIRFADVVENLIGLDVANVLSASLQLSGGTLRFLRPSEVDLINGVSPREYLPLIASWKADEAFLGNKEFGLVTVNGNLACHLINNVNLTHLELHAFSKTKNQFLSGKFTFEELQSTENLITSKISGIPISHFVRTDKDTTIKSDITFQNHQTKVEGKISLNGLLNNYKIEEVAERLRSLQGNLKFDTITVEGNLSWGMSDASLGRFSHLFQDSMTITTSQTINGKVTFSNGLRVNTLVSQKWLNGVNLGRILSDCVQRNAPVTFAGVNIFDKEIDVRHGPVTVTRHLDTLKVNNVTLRELYQDVVRTNSPKRIHGKKTFAQGLSTLNLNVYGEIDYVLPKDLITVKDKRIVDRVTLTHVTILKNMDYKQLNNYKMESLLQERITLDQDQRIYADLTFLEDLIVHDCIAQSINGVSLSDMFLQNKSQPQKFTGQKTFEDLKIEGSLENVVINEMHMDEIAEQLLHLERDEVIYRHVIFTDTVNLAHSIEIIGDDSDYAIGVIAEAFTADLENIVDNVLVSQETKQRTTESILELEKTQENKAVWLDYLELVHELGTFDNGTRHRVETFVNSNENGGITMAFHAPTLDTHGSLPIGCTCNSIRFLFMDGVVKPLEHVNCVNIFDVNTQNGESYTIYSQVISYNKTCSRRELGSTYISSSPGQFERYKVNIGSTMGKADWSVGQIETGYISDAKAFSVKDKQYLVMAQFYDHKLASHETEVLVYETNGRTLEKIQGIRSNGAHRLALEQVDGRWTLVVGNRGGGSLFSGDPCPVTASAIYEWSPVKSQFTLLREVQTEGLVDVALVTVQKNVYFHEAYASFAENGAEGKFGKVSIYRYDSLTTNYFILQTMEYNGPLGGIHALSLPQFSYLIVAVPSRGLEFYQYCHVERFKLKLTVPISETMDVNAFLHGTDLYFPVASGDDSVRAVMAKGILQGRLSN